MQTLGQKLLRLGPVVRYSSRQALDEDVVSLRAEGFRCIEYDCSGWTLHTDKYHEIIEPVLRATADQVNVPGAGAPGLNEFFDMFRSEGAGTAFVFRGWDAFARADGQAWNLLQLIASASRRRLIGAEWLLAMILVADMHLEIKPVGAVAVQIRQSGRPL
ncbi:MAG TPA: hypothetical protein VGE74_12125 [Gemmata sp.]